MFISRVISLSHLDTGAGHHIRVDNHRFRSEELVEKVLVKIYRLHNKVIRTIASSRGLIRIYYNHKIKVYFSFATCLYLVAVPVGVADCVLEGGHILVTAVVMGRGGHLDDLLRRGLGPQGAISEYVGLHRGEICLIVGHNVVFTFFRVCCRPDLVKDGLILALVTRILLNSDTDVGHRLFSPRCCDFLR